MSCVIVTMDAAPLPPVYAHNRVGIELLAALAGDWSVEALVYSGEGDRDALRAFAGSRPIRFHLLQRRRTWRHLRSLLQGMSIPTVTRDFVAEAALVARLARQNPGSRLIINFLSGAPLLRRVGGSGVVLSGHDCMSYLFTEEARHAGSRAKGWHFRVRRWFALNTERRFAHLAERVHLVTSHDARELRRVNPRVRTVVIPLGAETPDPSRLRPWTERHRRVVWGNLGSGPVLEGLRQIMAVSRTAGPHALAGWELIGRVPEAEAHRLLPELASGGLRYVERVSVMTGHLGETRLLLVPDIGGTGQKTRAQDGLAHGCCVIGLPEPFRGLEADGPPAFVCEATPEKLVRRIASLTDAEAAGLGEAGQRRFETLCSRAALRRQWTSLLDSLAPLSPR